MTDFIAIDFETANECASSVCSIGAVLVRNGEIVKTFYSLIKPEPNYYKWFCQQVHGLGHEDTDDADVFPYVWRRMEKELLEDVQILSEDTEGCEDAVPLVAHNADLIQDVSEKYSSATGWIIRSSCSTIPWRLQESIFAVLLRIISFRRSLQHVVMILPITIMHFQMQKLVHG